MEKVVLSVVLAALVGAAVVGGVVAVTSGDRSDSSPQLAAELSAIRADLAAARKERVNLAEKLEDLRSTQDLLATQVTESQDAVAVPAVATDGTEGTPAPTSTITPSRLTEYVLAAIEEDRNRQDEQRQQQRDEMRERMEERRRETEELSQGPYERLNLKVNSMAKVLAMTDVQKQAYFELVKGYSQKFDEARTQLREQRQAQEGQTTEGEGGDRRGRGRFEGGQQYRELYEGVQKEFTAGVTGILTAGQIETYNELSSSARSLQSTGLVSAPGEDPNPFGRMMEGFRGRGGGGRGGRGR